MKIESIKINKLKPATYNPRQISTKQYNDLKKSIERFGLVDPIIINKNGNVVVGGHQRLKICKELKHTEIDCVVLDLSKEEERELNIRLNKNSGEFDMDILANEFDIDELTDWGFKHIDLDLNIDKIQKDLSDKIELQYKIEVEVISEKEQEILYKDLTKKGYICQILTL
jgi:ParB-like chromosome segregation protein Spo0J